MKFGRDMSAALAICLVALAFVPASAQDARHHSGLSEAPGTQLSPEAAAFLAENEEAMGRMMETMHVAPTGDIDRDFVTMMIPHHQGAIDMARALLRSSRNEAVRRLAQEIIITQQDEIRAMRLAIGIHAMAAAWPASGTTGQDR